MVNSAFILFFTILFATLIVSFAVDTLDPTQSLRDGETILSAGGRYQLGFFSPNNSQNRFVGIWFNQIPVLTTVWIANRNSPLTDLAGNLMVTSRGLAVVNGTGSAVWSFNWTGSARNPIAQLLDSGNLVFKERNDTNPENYMWQSFDYPGDTLLAGMKLGTNNVTNVNRYLTSWRSDSDPAVGNFTFELDARGYPQLVMMQGSSLHYASGPWNGLRFSGSPNLRPNPYYRFYFVYDAQEIYYAYELLDSNVVTRLGIDPSGYVTRFIWNNQTLVWDTFPSIVIDVCDNYDFCGEYTSCNIERTPQCGCLRGYEPKREWAAQDWSHGCVRRTALDPDCGRGVGFYRYSGVKLPETTNSWFDRSMSLEDCRIACLNNCSCTAYTSLDISNGGSGCLVWFGELRNIREYSENGQVIYLRVASSDLATSNNRLIIYVASATSAAVILLLGLVVILCIRRKKAQRKQVLIKKGMSEANVSHTEDLELPLFEYATIAKATNKFCDDNKLGEGGFGPVYKGILEDGQEIAVKKLSKSSRQGVDEFKNEVLCIAKLQHRNLVKLLGCCIHVEKILVYEYMPNKSLDYFIFDEKQSKLLDWDKHFKIINGISRGLLYLHQDSRLRIIHRDLKASNILLDYEMNPKISDFGMARSFRDHETEANTNRVVGTYGYMSPEYAIDGLFSVKSDVFSYGVLVLETVSGKKNRGFIHQDHSLNLLGHAWNLHNEGRGMELLNECIRDSCNKFEALRSIHVALLCVQQSPEDRPNMSNVVLMLSSDTELPQPKLPGFYGERVLLFDGNSSLYDSVSANEMTDTIVDPR